MKRATISRGLAIASVSASMLLGGEAHSQSVAAPSPPQQAQDQSFNRGMLVTHPEDLSGVWETPDGHGGAVGIHLMLDTTAPADATTLVGTPQKWLGLTIGIYHRSGAGRHIGDENYFSDSPRGANLRYEDGRLTLRYAGYDIDLRRIAGNKWSGRFHREDFDSQVTLARPVLHGAWPIGTWKSADVAQITCLHIAEASPAGFLAWSDKLSVPGPATYSPGIPRPPYSWEHYGELTSVQPAKNGSVWIEIPAYSAICCSHRFHATSADRGQAMKADWPSGPNQSPHKSRWIKMAGDTCIAPQ